MGVCVLNMGVCVKQGRSCCMCLSGLTVGWTVLQVKAPPSGWAASPAPAWAGR